MHTIIKEYYENGALKAELSFRNGKLDGVSRFYSENGTLWATQSSRNGKRQGMHFRFPQQPAGQIWPYC